MIYRSTQPDIEIPDVSLTDHVLGRARELGDRVALADAVSGERLTYRELADGVETAAAGLARLGVGPGTVVALISHNQPRFALALHAALAAGAAVTPVNPVLTVDELTRQLSAANAVAAICAEQAAAKVAEAAKATGVRHLFLLDADASVSMADARPTAGSQPVSFLAASSQAGFRPFAELLATRAPAPRPALDPRTALAVLPFSSGTTGTSKGVMLTHRNLVANLEQNRVGWRLTEDDVLAAALPFFHIYGLTIILNSGLLAGATVVTLPRYSLDAYLRMLRDHRVTRAFFAPPMVLGIATALGVDDCDLPADLPALRAGICGAAPLDVAVAERAEARLGCLIRQGYGMTEASPGTHQVPDAEFATTPAGSVGRLLAATEARLVDPVTGTDVAAGEPGELWVRGPQVMAGYLDDPAATAATLVKGGWLRTGDILRVDEDGVFWVVDRLKELIKYKGYQVVPAELEALLLTHPDVLDAAVVGVPHPEGGEAPKAFVVPAGTGPTGTGPARTGPAGTVLAGTGDAEKLMAWVAERVAPYKKIRAVEFVAEIPKSPTGKILRRLLR